MRKLTLLILCTAGMVFLKAKPVWPATLEVRPPGGIGTLGDVYTSIQQAIDDASDGDTIYIHDGTYTETLTITGKGLTIIGDNESSVIIQASETGPVAGNNVFTINADGKDITIQSVTIRNGDYGIRSTAGNVNVLNCTFYHNGWDGTPYPEPPTQQGAADMWASEHTTNGGAMRIENSAGSEIAYCTVYENARAIRYQDGDNGNIHNNDVHDNIECGIYLAASSYDGASGCTNTDVNDNQSYNNMNNGILCIGGRNNTIRNNDIQDNWNSGVALWHVAETTVQGNTINHNNLYSFNGVGSPGDAYGGVYAVGSTNVAGDAAFVFKLLGNTISDNQAGAAAQAIGIRLGDSLPGNGIEITGNTLANHDVDIHVRSQAATTSVHQNVFDGAGIGAQNDDTSATLDAESNYWGDASGPYNASTNPGGQGDDVSDFVDFYPWYLDPNKDSLIYDPVHNVNKDTYYDTIQDAIDDAEEGDTITADPCTYDESVTVNVNNLTLIGIEGSKPRITGGLKLDTDLTGFTLNNFYVSGTVVASPNSVVRMYGAVTNLTVENCIFDGENVPGRNGFSGGQLEGDVAIKNCEFKNILGWAVLDSRSGSGGDGSAMDTVTFADNYIHNCNGSVVFRGLSTDRTDAVNAYGNTWNNIGGNAGEKGQHWAALEINRTVDANVYDNTVDGVAESQWGEGQALQLWDIDNLNVHDNTFTNNDQGIYIHGSDPAYGGTLAVPGGSIYCNIISDNNDYGISVDPTATGGPLDARYNWWGESSGPSGEGGGSGDAVLGNVDFFPWLLSTDCSDYTEQSADFVVDDDWEGLPNWTTVTVGGVDYYIGLNAFATIQGAVDAATDGNSIKVLDGSYAGAIVNEKLQIVGADGSNAVITSGVPYKDGGGLETAFRLDSDADGTELSNFVIDCNRDNNFFFAVFARSADDVVVDSLTVNKPVQGITNWGGSNWQITNNALHETGAAGGGGIAIMVGARPPDYCVASGNLIQGNVITPTATALAYTCPAIAVSLDLRYGGYEAMTGAEDVSYNQVVDNDIAGNGLGSEVGVEIGVIGVSDDPNKIAATLGLVHDNLVRGNIIETVDWGVYFYTVADLDVQANEIIDCNEAVHIEDSHVGVGVNFNVITGSSSYGVNNTGGVPVDATYNWWGRISGPNDPAGTVETDGVSCADVSLIKNADGKGDTVTDGDVVYCPWLLTPPVSSSGVCPLGDMDGDCDVDWLDFALLAEHWLEGVEP